MTEPRLAPRRLASGVDPKRPQPTSLRQAGCAAFANAAPPRGRRRAALDPAACIEVQIVLEKPKQDLPA
jgi:hypothetical protein